LEKVKREARGGEVMCFEQPPAEYRAPFPLRSVTECREPVNLVNSVPKLLREPVNLVNSVPKLLSRLPFDADHRKQNYHSAKSVLTNA
jgi:hypothetical protein